MEERKVGVADPSTSSSPSSSSSASVDVAFRYDEEAIAAQRKQKPWDAESAAPSTAPPFALCLHCLHLTVLSPCSVCGTLRSVGCLHSQP